MKNKEVERTANTVVSDAVQLSLVHLAVEHPSMEPDAFSRNLIADRVDNKVAPAYEEDRNDIDRYAVKLIISYEQEKPDNNPDEEVGEVEYLRWPDDHHCFFTCRHGWPRQRFRRVN
ncbi:Uncharacterised protein [Providencia rustigianii]|uniref:Uncharacterized protein n=1 Tax=Providencia rustigianii TaxID=158850 RepID=A0A379FYV0_9GAMM|nr:Uncharacterised protein [Providencia rustigianii]